jgi:GNAT superfamily N-acetyltransferase
MEAARRATAADAGDLARLGGEARESVRSQRGGALWLAQDGRANLPPATIEELLADDGYEVVVGTVDDVTVGYAIAAGRPPVAVIEELFVEPGAREVGVGEALVGHLLEWARARGCTGIDGFALPGDRATKNLFERVGMVARAIIVHKPLEDT